MDLFVVNRYTGEDEVSKKIDEQKKLTKILKNVEKRKRLRVQRKLKGLGQVDKLARKQEDKLIHENKDVVQNNQEKIKQTDNKLPNKIQFEKDDITSTLANINTESFKVLGTDKFDTKIKVKRVLPDWLLNPVVISGTLDKSNLVKIKDVEGIDKEVKKELKSTGIKRFFPVQSTVMPFLLDSAVKRTFGIIPQDICVSAPTGSGKTLAYVIPILQALKDSPYHTVRALVILPTQSLAVQIYEAFKLYSKNLDVEIGLITGSCPLKKEQKQIIMTNCIWGNVSKIDVLVCTPGRLVEHIKCTKGLDLKTIEYLVIDEADRVLDNIQDDWLYHLETHLHIQDHSNKLFCNVQNTITRVRAQRLLFSATLSQDPEKLEKLNLFQPILFTSVINNNDSDDEIRMKVDSSHFIGKYTMPIELTEKYMLCSLETKPLALYKYIKDEKLTNVLVFTNTIDSVHRLRILLKALAPDLNVREVSSKLTLKKKNTLMKIFASGSVDVLVCTDAMARGIDLPNVHAVLSYAAPNYLKTYIHRVGRTARAGVKGTAVTLVEPQQKEKFLAMLKSAEKADLQQVELNMEELSLLSDQYKEALQTLKKQLENEEDISKLQVKKEKGLFKKKFRKSKCDTKTEVKNE